MKLNMFAKTVLVISLLTNLSFGMKFKSESVKNLQDLPPDIIFHKIPAYLNSEEAENIKKLCGNELCPNTKYIVQTFSILSKGFRDLLHVKYILTKNEIIGIRNEDKCNSALNFLTSYQKVLKDNEVQAYGNESISFVFDKKKFESTGIEKIRDYILLIDEQGTLEINKNNTKSLYLNYMPVKNITFKHRLPKLEFVTLMECYQLTDQAIVNLSKNCPNVKYLNIRSCNEITAEGLRCIAKFEELRFLNLSCCKKVTAECLAEISANCKQLAALYLFNCWAVSEDENLTSKINAIAKMTNLKDLDLSSFWALDDGALKQLTKNLTELNKLNLRNCSKITDAGTENFKNLKNLEELDLQECGKLTAESLSHMPASLRILHLNRCFKINEEDIRDFKDKHPDCKVFHHAYKESSNEPEENQDTSYCNVQ